MPAGWKSVGILEFSQKQHIYTCNQGEGRGLLAGVNQFPVQ